MKRKILMILGFVPVFILLFPGILSAQLSQGGIPRSFSQAMASDTTASVSVAPPATGVLSAEDAVKPVPYRFSVNIPVNLGMGISGYWSKASGGTKVWRLNISSAGALALTLFFDRFRIPEGGRLFVYNPLRTQVIGAFTAANNNTMQTFATALIYGDKLTLEYDAPEGLALPELHVSEVAYAYRGISEYSGLKTGFGGSGKCEVNVNCTEGNQWQPEKRSVARIMVKRGTASFWCTGSLVNNTLNDGKPYLITADHCGNQSSATDLSQWIFYFNYESADCANPSNEPTLKSMTGASLVAHGGNSGTTGSDFYLVLLNNEIPSIYHPFFNGWNRDPMVASPSGAGIHHPEGDIKKISTYTQPLQPSNWNGGSKVSHWMVTWSETLHGHGTTEGGSSGSPLFDNQGRLVGTLTGGQSSCDSVALNSPDYYGQFAYHWDQNGTDSLSVLKYWLDPNNSGVMSLGGFSLSVDETTPATSVSVFPNPVTDMLTVTVSGPSGGQISVVITDLWGKQLLKSNFKPLKNNQYQINMASLADGMYLVKILAGEKQVIRKIIKK
ncbi:MAG: T9SS type A sorting domain-containing protein [Bacteroidota bacterium]